MPSVNYGGIHAGIYTNVYTLKGGGIFYLFICFD